MQLDDFTTFLDDQGIDWKEAGQSLVLKTCPACGDNRWKVHLRIERESEHEPFLGRCYAGNCQENFSSIKYLLQHEAEYEEVMHLHGRNPNAALRGMTVDQALEEAAKNAGKPTLKIGKEIIKDRDTSGFFALKDWPDHPAAQYAASRGALPIHEAVMIDPGSNAVVFVARNGDEVLGFQRRFLEPRNPNEKTKSSLGFEKTKCLLHFPRPAAKILICEGPFTAISAWHYGYYAICTFGSGVSEEQIKLIAELSERLKQPVGVAFDLDPAGKDGLAKIRCGLFWKDQEVFRVVADTKEPLPLGFDLNDAWKKGMKIKEVMDDWAGPAVPEIPEFL
jgi:hypothetical protein